MDPLQPGDPDQVGRYRLIGRLGEGGMGRVFLGVSPDGLAVAVKLIHPGHAGSQYRERFAREVQAARQVGGFHTAPVVDADPDGDPPWMVTAYIHGPSLQAEVVERGPLNVDKLCTLGAALAEGLAGIHACNLVHRDLKPSNVILAEDGPRIIDFGIARAAEADRITETGTMVGTCSYMSPEQVRGELGGPASDVFSLGCTLAFAASGRSPFGDESIPAVVHRVLSEPPDLTDVTGERGFRPLLIECLAKAPGDRPGLDDIISRLNLSDMPTETIQRGSGMPEGRANPPEPPDQGLKVTPEPKSWRSHLPRLGVLIAAGAAVIVLLGTGLGLGVLLTRGGPGPAPPPPTSPSAHPSVPPERPDAILRDPSSQGINGVVFTSGNVLAAGDRNGSTYLWNVADKKVTATLQDPGGSRVDDVAFSQGGDSVAAADGNGSVYVWDVASSKVTATLPDPGSKGVIGVAFGPDGFLAAADANGSVYVWDVASSKVTATLPDPGSKGVYEVAFSPDGFLAAADLNGSVYLWEVATGKLAVTLRDPASRGVNYVAFRPGGGFLAAADANGSVYLWDVATAKPAAPLNDPGSKGVSEVAFSPRGGYLAAADANGWVYLWEVATSKPPIPLHYPASKGAVGIAFNPDGSSLAVGDANGSVYLWNMRWLSS